MDEPIVFGESRNKSHHQGRLNPGLHQTVSAPADDSLNNRTTAVLFSLLSSPRAIEALNQSYLLVMPELFVALVLTAWRDAQACERLLKIVFSSYALGLLCFLVLPAVGPCIAYPESLRVAALPAWSPPSPSIPFCWRSTSDARRPWRDRRFPRPAHGCIQVRPRPCRFLGRLAIRMWSHAGRVFDDSSCPSFVNSRDGTW